MLATTVGASSGRPSRRLRRSKLDRDAVGLGVGGRRLDRGLPRGRSRAPGPSRALPRRSRGRRSRCRDRSAVRWPRPPRPARAGARRQSRVVGWAPVPKARPGSTTRSIAPSRGSSQEGRSQSRSPTSSGLWKSCQRSAQSSGTSVGDHLDQAVAGRRPRSRPARAARPRRRRSRTRRSRARAPPRPRWAPARSARRGRSRPARARSGRRGGSTEGSAHAGEEALVVALLRSAGCAASSVSPSFSASSRCSSERSLGTITWTTIARSPGGPPFGPGRPWPRSANWVPCWVPDGSSISRSPSWLGILIAGPEHRVDRGDLDRVDEVLAAHRPAPHLEAEGCR